MITMYEMIMTNALDATACLTPRVVTSHEQMPKLDHFCSFYVYTCLNAVVYYYFYFIFKFILI
jgi:hypothetical protein